MKNEERGTRNEKRRDPLHAERRGIRKCLTWMAARLIFVKIIHGWLHGVIAGLVHPSLQPQGARKRSLNRLNAGGNDEPAG